MFDLSFFKLLTLAVIALVVFGPNELPKMAAQAGRWLRDLRRMADVAKNDLREGLGPEFANFELEDLHPKRFVQKHLLDDIETSFKEPIESTWSGQDPASQAPAMSLLAPGEVPPYDGEAT